MVVFNKQDITLIYIFYSVQEIIKILFLDSFYYIRETVICIHIAEMYFIYFVDILKMVVRNFWNDHQDLPR